MSFVLSSSDCAHPQKDGSAPVNTVHSTSGVASRFGGADLYVALFFVPRVFCTRQLLMPRHLTPNRYPVPPRTVLLSVFSLQYTARILEIEFVDIEELINRDFGVIEVSPSGGQRANLSHSWLSVTPGMLEVAASLTFYFKMVRRHLVVNSRFLFFL